MASGAFTVIVRGRIGPEVALALEGFDVREIDGGRTSVTGDVADQTALLSLLTVFDDLHFAVESVNPVGTSSSGTSSWGKSSPGNDAASVPSP